ncbi:MAG: exodeoxyribonuclease-3 [Candidatus Azotimanducaceae bacterium]
MRLHQLDAVIKQHAPTLIGLQETKATDEDFPIDDIREMGYDVAFMGQKTHYGVALLYRAEATSIIKGFEHDTEDSQKRLIGGTFKTKDGAPLTVLNGYFPQGESRSHDTKFPAKQKFYADLNRYLKETQDPKGAVIVMGDMNIAPVDEDIGIGDANKKRWLRDGKTSFLPEEREWLKEMTDWGLTDLYRHLHPEVDDKFSWFDYRSRGFEREPRRGLRIDLLLATDILKGGCTAAGIDYDIRAMDKPSDHCPIWADLDVELA